MGRSVSIDPALAMRAVQRQLPAGVELVQPDDARRIPIVYLLGAAYELTGYGWRVEDVRERISVTLPGLGTGGTAIFGGLARGIPMVGDLLADFLAKNLRDTGIFLSPFAVRDGITLVSTYKHEESHAGWIAKGGIPLCLAYLVAPEVRGGTESPCFACNMAHEVILRGTSRWEACEAASARLESYGLDAAARDLAHANLQAAALSLATAEQKRNAEGWEAALAFDPTGTVVETVEALRAEGWRGE